MTLDGIGILIIRILGFCGLFWRQSAWSSHVDKADREPTSAAGWTAFDNRLDAFVEEQYGIYLPSAPW